VSTETLKFEIPKLPQLDKQDVKAIRSFLPGKLLGRTAAFLSLVLGVLLAVAAIKFVLNTFDLGIPIWAYGLLIGLCFVAVVAQVAQEWLAERTRRSMQIRAVKPGAEQTGYFRIGPYQNTPEDRTKFKRADHAEQKALEWIEKSNQIPLYLCGDSGCGKSSLLNAFVLPKMSEQGWTVVETRAWQDPEPALRDALLKLPGPRRRNAKSQGLRETVEDAAKQAPDRLLIVLDQFEEFVILGKPEQQQKFAAFVAELKSRPVKGLALLLVIRSEYQVQLGEVGLPLLRSGENLFQVGRFIFPAASAFIKGSGLDLQADAIDRLLTSAAELDGTPGVVRPITLNVTGYVLASGKAVAPSLDAGILIRRYIERAVEQPWIRDCAPQLLEQMITEQGTKRPRAEEQLVTDTNLRPAEVRAVLNALHEAGLARTLDKERAEWELSHDFVAHAVGRFLGRRRSQMLRQAGAYSAPALLAISLLGGMWINQSYLKEQWTWYMMQRPFARANIWPYVLTPEAELALKPGIPFRECADKDMDICPEMVLVPTGSFTMGSPPTEMGHYDNEGPQRTVAIAKPFAVAKNEVTFDEWDTCVRYGDCSQDVSHSNWGRGDRPVINVTWDQAQRYTAWLSRMTGKPYRLLTEAEYEYAARAGTQTAYPWGDDIKLNGKAMANCVGCSSEWDLRQTAPVGKFDPNKFGLYDMVGNVYTWVEDCFHDHYDGAPTDGSARIEDGDCNNRVVRGGSWRSAPENLRSAHRGWDTPDIRNNNLGLRLARTLTP
jgi:formylglycine-generating enzyme required for sulfatase activity